VTFGLAWAVLQPMLLSMRTNLTLSNPSTDYDDSMKYLTVFLFGFISCVTLAQGWTYQPDCLATLKMTPEDFTSLFTERNNDTSEYAYDSAGTIWADCKHKANLVLLGNFPRTAERVSKLRTLENQLFSAETYLAYHQAGGGTMYPHGRARFQPEIELHIERVIKLTTTRAGAATSSEIKSRYQRAINTVKANLKRIKNPTRQDLEYTLRKDWDATARLYEAAWNAIVLIANAPDAASLEIVEFVARGLWMDQILKGSR
jgi:hypothetical protein